MSWTTAEELLSSTLVADTAFGQLTTHAPRDGSTPYTLNLSFDPDTETALGETYMMFIGHGPNFQVEPEARDVLTLNGTSYRVIAVKRRYSQRLMQVEPL